MTKEEYIDSVYKETYVIPSWIYDVVIFDYDDGLKYYAGLEYNKAWPEEGWFYVVLKIYKDPSYEPPTLYQNVQMEPYYSVKRRANELERKMLLEELYKTNLKVIRVDDNGVVEYKIEKF